MRASLAPADSCTHTLSYWWLVIDGIAWKPSPEWALCVSPVAVDTVVVCRLGFVMSLLAGELERGKLKGQRPDVAAAERQRQASIRFAPDTSPVAGVLLGPNQELGTRNSVAGVITAASQH